MAPVGLRVNPTWIVPAATSNGEVTAASYLSDAPTARDAPEAVCSAVWPRTVLRVLFQTTPRNEHEASLPRSQTPIRVIRPASGIVTAVQCWLLTPDPHHSEP